MLELVDVYTPDGVLAVENAKLLGYRVVKESDGGHALYWRDQRVTREGLSFRQAIYAWQDLKKYGKVHEGLPPAMHLEREALLGMFVAFLSNVIDCDYGADEAREELEALGLVECVWCAESSDTVAERWLLPHQVAGRSSDPEGPMCKGCWEAAAGEGAK